MDLSCHSTCKLGSIGKVQGPDHLHFAESCTTQQKKAKMQLNWNGTLSGFFGTDAKTKFKKKKSFGPKHLAKYLKSLVQSLRTS